MSRPKLTASALCAMAVVAVLLGTGAPSFGYAPLRLRPIGQSFGPLRSDGARWAAYQPTDATTRLIDAQTGRAVNRRDPAGCDFRRHQEGGLIAVGGGELLYRCENSGCGVQRWACPGPNDAYWSERYLVEDAATGLEHEITRLPFNPEVPQLNAIGSQWSRGDAVAYKYDYRFYLNWRTGEIESPSESVATRGIDLDSTMLTRPFCAPIRRVLDLGLFDEREPEPLYSPPFAIEQREIKVPGFELNSGVEVNLRHCGSQRRERLPLSHRYVTSAQIDGGVASWIAPGKNNGAAVYAFRLHSRGSKWHGAVYLLYGPKYSTVPGAPIRGGWTLAHTSAMVYQSDVLQEKPEISSSDERTAIYAARIP